MSEKMTYAPGQLKYIVKNQQRTNKRSVCGRFIKVEKFIPLPCKGPNAEPSKLKGKTNYNGHCYKDSRFYRPFECSVFIKKKIFKMKDKCKDKYPCLLKESKKIWKEFKNMRKNDKTNINVKLPQNIEKELNKPKTKLKLFDVKKALKAKSVKAKSVKAESEDNDYMLDNFFGDRYGDKDWPVKSDNNSFFNIFD